jgi:hypothetical protein
MIRAAEQSRNFDTIQSGPSRPRWLLLVHQLPPRPSNARVKTWRRLQRVGAIAVKPSVYALPNTPAAKEDFEWLRSEIVTLGGEASVFTADAAGGPSDEDLVEEFRRAREGEFDALTRDIERVERRLTRRRGALSGPDARRAVRAFREQLARIEAIDFFAAAGRDRAAQVLRQLEERIARRGQPPGGAHPPAGTLDPTSFRARTWVTRPRPGVDRMASAWLVRRFIDPEARFVFAEGRETVAPEHVAFDMYGIGFSHEGDASTFETLSQQFGIAAPAVTSIAEIVHDLDLKDERYARAETGAIGLLIEGLRRTYQQDEDLLAQGMVLFEALYRSFDDVARRQPRPRPVAGWRRRAQRRGA